MQQKQAWGSGQISEEKQQQSSSSSSASNRVKCLDDVVLLRQIGEPTHKNTIPSRTEVEVGTAEEDRALLKTIKEQDGNWDQIAVKMDGSRSMYSL